MTRGTLVATGLLAVAGGCQVLAGIEAKELGASAASGDAGVDGAPACDDGRPDCVPSCVARRPGADARCGDEVTEDCCESRRVKGGAFLRDYDGIDGGPYSDPGFSASVSEFSLDTFEITVGRFRAFLEAGKGTQEDPPAEGAGSHPKIKGSGWSNAFNLYLQPNREALERSLERDQLGTWTHEPGERERMPITHVSWYEAFAFCVWDHARLPTNAEFAYAAHGGSEQRVYPWGTTVDGTRAVYDCGRAHGGDPKKCTASDLLPVGSKPEGAGRWGQRDLAGSVAEWMLDSACGSYGPSCVDCAAVGPCPARAIRSGDLTAHAEWIKSAWAESDVSLAAAHVMGARCARD